MSLRQLLPFASKEKTAQPGERSGKAWQDVCFIHSIPGDENDEGLLVLADGSLRKYLRVDGINTLFKDELEREQLVRNFSNFLQKLESDIQILIKSKNVPVDDFLSEHLIPVKTDIEYLKWYADQIDKWYRRVQEVKYVAQREFYLVLSYEPPDRKQSSSPWSGRRSIHKHEEFVGELNRLVKAAGEHLAACRLSVQVLTKKELRNLIFCDLNPVAAESSSIAPPARSHISEASCLARSALKVSDEHIWLDGRYIGTQYMAELPGEPTFGWLADLLGSPVEYTFSMFVHTDKKQAWQKKMQDAPETPALAGARFAAGSYLPAFSELGYAQARALNQTAGLFDVSCYIRVHGQSPDALARNMNEIRGVFKQWKVIIDRAQTLQLEAWQSTLSVAVDRLAIVHPLNLLTLGTYWPFFAASCGTPDGVPFGFSSEIAEPVLINPFFKGQGKETNNMLVAGAAGKSFVVCLLILRLLPLGVRFSLIDKSSSVRSNYRFLTEITGPDVSDYVSLGSQAGRVLNPFDLESVDQTGQPPADKVNMLLRLFDLMLVSDGQSQLPAEEKSLLEGLVHLAYMDCQTRGTMPTISDLAHLAGQAAAGEVDLRQRQKLEGLRQGLSIYTAGGARRSFIDGQTNIDTEKLLMVFDTSQIKEPHLDRVAAFVVGEFMKRQAAQCRRRGLRYAAIIDEAAGFMQFQSGAWLLDDLSKHAWQHGMMLVSAMQDLGEFLKYAPQAISIVKEAQTKILLGQAAGKIKLLKEALNLTDAEAALLKEFSTKEETSREYRLLLLAGSVHGAARLAPSDMDYWICACVLPSDLLRRDEMIEEVKKKNPRLTHTDACRQAVYFLHLQGKG